MDVNNTVQLINSFNQTNAPAQAQNRINPQNTGGIPITTLPETDPAAIFDSTRPPEGPLNAAQRRVAGLWRDHEAQVESFRRMVEALIARQAGVENTARPPGVGPGGAVHLPGTIGPEVTDAEQAEALSLIGEGGYFSVEETAARLLNFAVTLTGGDQNRIELMRDAVQRGFDQAERMFGGELPEISHQTLAAVMEGFDQWAAGGVSAIALLNRD